MPLGELRQKAHGHSGPSASRSGSGGSRWSWSGINDLDPRLAGIYGIRYTVITERGTRLAALQAGRLDAFVPLEMTKAMAEAAKKSAPSLVITEVGQNGSDNVVINHKRPPFEIPRCAAR